LRIHRNKPIQHGFRESKTDIYYYVDAILQQIYTGQRTYL